MADADLSMPWDNLSRFLDAAAQRDAPQIVIGSREAPGAERTGEAWSRRVSGRVFNALVRLFAVPGIADSQCGYKMLSADAVAALAPHLTLDGFAFDVELLYLARLAGFRDPRGRHHLPLPPGQPCARTRRDCVCAGCAAREDEGAPYFVQRAARPPCFGVFSR